MPVTPAASSPSTKKTNLTEDQQVTEEILAAGLVTLQKRVEDLIIKTREINKASAEGSG